MNSSAGASSTDAADMPRRQERDIGEYVREEPLTALAIASGVGFILGGGANSRVGLALLTIVGRIALRGAATDLIVGLVTGRSDGRERDRAKARGGSSRNGNNDD
jgi:hypothetical protein